MGCAHYTQRLKSKLDLLGHVFFCLMNGPMLVSSEDWMYWCLGVAAKKNHTPPVFSCAVSLWSRTKKQ